MFSGLMIWSETMHIKKHGVNNVRGTGNGTSFFSKTKHSRYNINFYSFTFTSMSITVKSVAIIAGTGVISI